MSQMNTIAVKRILRIHMAISSNIESILKIAGQGTRKNPLSSPCNSSTRCSRTRRPRPRRSPPPARPDLRHHRGPPRRSIDPATGCTPTGRPTGRESTRSTPTTSGFFHVSLGYTPAAPSPMRTSEVSLASATYSLFTSRATCESTPRVTFSSRLEAAYLSPHGWSCFGASTPTRNGPGSCRPRLANPSSTSPMSLVSCGSSRRTSNSPEDWR